MEIILKPMVGSHIDKSAEKAIRIAATINHVHRITFEFNGVKIPVYPNASIDDLRGQYWLRCAEARES